MDAHLYLRDLHVVIAKQSLPHLEHLFQKWVRLVPPSRLLEMISNVVQRGGHVRVVPTAMHSPQQRERLFVLFLGLLQAAGIGQNRPYALCRSRDLGADSPRCFLDEHLECFLVELERLIVPTQKPQQKSLVGQARGNGDVLRSKIFLENAVGLVELGDGLLLVALRTVWPV
jgi:hypothetical protein